MFGRLVTYSFVTVLFWATPVAMPVEPLQVRLRYQQQTSSGSERYHRVHRDEKWNPEETAIIVCDMWDYHHCRNAVRRLEEFVPRLNRVLTTARDHGVTIIHAPSDCMDAYKGHPARKRAENVPAADFVPHDCTTWCSVLPSEEQAVYPIDQSDGGEDDDPAEHAEWAQKLRDMGRNPAMPWQNQTSQITIDGTRDYITDRGDEAWNILQQQGIRNVILTGVHTNMCVLGRPFGLRQMARNGKNVVLMRDMTDTMYNPQRWPYVSHFSGTDYIVSHIEKYICPTITSDQFLGGRPFRFARDTRPHLVMLIAEDEYHTNDTLPTFAVSHLGRDFRVTTVFGSDHERNSVPGIEVIQEADVLLVSVRRRVLPEDDMKVIRDFVHSGRPVVGLRTASHAFALRNTEPPDGFADWPEFDAEVFGGNYHGHHGNELKSQVSVTATEPHDILNGISRQAEHQGGSLYMTSPLADGTAVLTTGTIDGKPPEPVTWTFQRSDGGRSFYSSMGHPLDFENSEFKKLLYQGICWAARISPTESPEPDHWSAVKVPLAEVPRHKPAQAAWYRCAIHIPAGWSASPRNLTLKLHGNSAKTALWVNGSQLEQTQATDSKATVFTVPSSVVHADDTNLLVIRVAYNQHDAFLHPPQMTSDADDSHESLLLSGQWQRRFGGDESLANMPLPAKFGASAGIVFSPPEPLWTARPLTQSGAFTSGIEGPACDPHGNIFAVNFRRQGTIGRISPDGSGEVFVTLPEGSIGNGIRFDADGNFYVADYPRHNILKVDTKTRAVTKLAHDDRMNQPNDLAIAGDGTLYASDPDWSSGTGRLWRIDGDGTTTLLAEDMGTTNGIEVSPDGRHLYVNESKQRNVWVFDITQDRTLANRRLVRQFDSHGFDGMRCDVDGNLYITRHSKGTVIKMTPSGDILQEVNVLGAKPSNLCFGGPDGCTVYVTEVEGTRLVSFRVDRPGRAWAAIQK